MEQLREAIGARLLVKKIKTVLKEHGIPSVYAMHRDYFKDIPQRTFYFWTSRPEEMPLGIARRLAKALGISSQELIDELCGK